MIQTNTSYWSKRHEMMMLNVFSITYFRMSKSGGLLN